MKFYVGRQSAESCHDDLPSLDSSWSPSLLEGWGVGGGGGLEHMGKFSVTGQP